MSDSLCACIRVKYEPDQLDGTESGRLREAWKCDSCGTRFVRELFLNQAKAEIVNLTLLSDSQLANQEKDASTCVCGKPIWGEGWEPGTGQRFFSHVDGGEEMHEDKSWVRPAKYSDWFAIPRAWKERCDDMHRVRELQAELATERANQERLVGEMQELREVVKAYRQEHFSGSMRCVEGESGRCHTCIEADLSLAKDTPTEPTQEK